VTVDPGERELFAQFLGVAVVRLEADRALEEESFVETIQLVLNRFRGLTEQGSLNMYPALTNELDRSAGA
jgi:hypothetical protein